MDLLVLRRTGAGFIFGLMIPLSGVLRRRLPLSTGDTYAGMKIGVAERSADAITDPQQNRQNDSRNRLACKTFRERL